MRLENTIKLKFERFAPLEVANFSRSVELALQQKIKRAIV